MTSPKPTFAAWTAEPCRQALRQNAPQRQRELYAGAGALLDRLLLDPATELGAEGIDHPQFHRTPSYKTHPLHGLTGTNRRLHWTIFDSSRDAWDGGKMSTDQTRKASLTAELNGFICAHVASGQHQNASEVLRAGLRLLVQQAQKAQRKKPATKERGLDAPQQ